MFNRYHNWMATQLPLINEGGKFTQPSDKLTGDKKERAWKKYDEDIFQTSRLVVNGIYINIILLDYLRTIVNLNRVNSTWTLVSTLWCRSLPANKVPGSSSGHGKGPQECPSRSRKSSVLRIQPCIQMAFLYLSQR